MMKSLAKKRPLLTVSLVELRKCYQVLIINLFILLAVLLSNNASAQVDLNNLRNNWIQVDVTRLDGSKILAVPHVKDVFQSLKIDDNKLYFNSSPVSPRKAFEIPYKLLGHTIITSEFAGYEIQMLSKDSLIYSEKFKDQDDPEKLKKFTFVRSGLLDESFNRRYADSLEIRANKFFTPRLKSSIELPIMKRIKSDNNLYTTNFLGEITIYPKKKLVTTEFKEKPHSNQELMNSIRSVIDKSFADWDLEGFKKYDAIRIPFAFNSEISKTYEGINIFFFCEDKKKIKSYFGIPPQQQREENRLFDEGIQAYQQKEYDVAINLFKKCFDLSKINVDALYNMVAIYNETGQTEKAIEILNQLIELGQVRAQKFLRENIANSSLESHSVEQRPIK